MSSFQSTTRENGKQITFASAVLYCTALKTQQWPQDCKWPLFIPIPKKDSAKE